MPVPICQQDFANNDYPRCSGQLVLGEQSQQGFYHACQNPYLIDNSNGRVICPSQYIRTNDISTVDPAYYLFELDSYLTNNGFFQSPQGLNSIPVQSFIDNGSGNNESDLVSALETNTDTAQFTTGAMLALALIGSFFYGIIKTLRS